MNSYSRNKSTYSAGLVSGNISSSETPVTGGQRKLRDSQFTLSSAENNSNLSFPGRTVIQDESDEDDDDEDSDWDLEPELEIAKVQQASLLHRRIPSLRKQPQVVPVVSHSAPSKPKGSSPYYCEEVGPQLDLGYQWPQDVYQKSRGFRKVSPRDNLSRQRDIDRRLLTNRHKSKSRLLSMTVNLKETFNTNNPKFNYDQEKIPKRILTKPSKPFRNEGNDNENFDYILKVNEVLGHDPNFKYRVIDILGQGTFGQVVKCERISTGELFSVKVIKNKSAYKTQSCMEIEILKKLNTQLDPEDKHHILRLHHIFSHKNHLCLVFELLSYNLYDLIGHNRYKGFAPEKVRAFAVQILDTLSLLKEAKIIHCDLKPENILLENEKSLTIKVIDFGSSCHEANRIYTYIQSRFYRSPEVILGMRYTGAIDMWSFGCIVAELFLGLPLFPGSSEYNQLFRIVEMLGTPSKDMLSKGRNTNKFFNKNSTGFDSFEYELKSREQYSHENSKNELPRKKYFPQTQLKDIILMYNNGKPQLSKEETEKRRSSGSVNYLREEEERQKEMEARLCILDFLYGVLELNPLKRWTPQQALQHPFITQKPFTGPFKPDGQIKFTTSISSASTLANFNPNEKPVHSGTRRRAESMNKPVAPEQLQLIAKKIQSPITKYPKEHDGSDNVHPKQAPPSDAYRQRNTRSQGDYIGLLPPEIPVEKKKVLLDDRKVKISPQIKVRTGSHESMRVPPNDGQTVRGVDGKSKFGNVRKSHAGEAAGGLLMMRQKDNDDMAKQQVVQNGKRSMAGAFKRRSLK
ncbi:kinase-like domain-containing protein [Mucor mucedo]|uniref:kinase-like domain-containing protein n=1 Tax=Mucor mucedo TaxID=29922 RepID=UPI00221F1F24|nr:kinase-like domain-containing protein [Mucor mucedo]KAI7892183.1 kinase-like domain-containing protein [Mucor mucedo]